MFLREEFADGELSIEDFDHETTGETEVTTTAFNTFGKLNDSSDNIQLSDLQQVYKSAELKSASGLAGSIVEAATDFRSADGFVCFSENSIQEAHTNFDGAGYDLTHLPAEIQSLFGEDGTIDFNNYMVFFYWTLHNGITDGDIQASGDTEYSDISANYEEYQQKILEGYVPGTEEEVVADVSATDLLVALQTLNEDTGIEDVDTSDGLTEAELDLIIASDLFSELTTDEQAIINDLKANFVEYDTEDTESTENLTEAEINAAAYNIISEEVAEEATEEDITAETVAMEEEVVVDTTDIEETVEIT